ncbi:chaperonin 10-like protein [Exophiala viscosa]|uniref:Chaperonin 10-like protein n=1 Tax=Exophiala viscosa TaxID=2486360 RepID=A0AAN6IF00_9EURO|nr:chaperonin 10-like protein [Exophiala viscosa]
MPIIEKDNEIMIRSRAVGLNHIDWKSVQYNICLPSFPWIMGREMAGVVEKVGSAVTDFKVGDHVWTSTYYRDRRAGCFQEFVVVPELTVSSIPSNLTFESAACLGVGAITAAMTLWKWLEVPMPSALSVSSSEEAANAEQYILIWGGSTIVGQFAIQIALRGNFNVIAVSSEESRSIIEEFGNVHVVTRCNRSNGEIIAEIRKIGGDRTVKAMDLVGSETAACCIRALSTTLPSIFAHLVTMPKSLSIPSNITVREVAMKKFVLDESSKAYSTELNEIVQSGVVKLPQISILEGGLSRVDEGLRILQMGGMKGRKLVVSM